MIRFMSDTRYAGLEKEMQHIPGFRPRTVSYTHLDVYKRQCLFIVIFLW